MIQVQEKNMGLRILQSIMKAIQECMIPVIPMIMAGGLIKVLIIILTLTGILSSGSQTHAILSAIGDAPYYFLPFEVAVCAAKYFRLPVLLPVAAVGIMFSPDFLGLFSASAVSFFGLPVSDVTYSYSVLPIILLVWVMGILYRQVEKHMPESLFNFFGHMLVLLFSSLLAVLVIGPIGNGIAEVIRAFVMWIQSVNHIMAEVCFAVMFPFLNMCGMQWPFILDAISTVGQSGFEALCIISLLCVNVSQGGACLSTAVRSKNKKRREQCFGMGITAVISGASEPSTYSNFSYKRPMAAALIGSAAAGLYAGIVTVKAFSFVPPAAASILIFMDAENGMNLVHAVITGLIALGVSFGAGMILGFNEPEETEDANEAE